MLNRPIANAMNSLIPKIAANIAAMSFLTVCLMGSRFSSSLIAQEPPPKIAGGALEGERYRVVVSTDIGGTDPDDFQSMVHLLLYADVLDLEGLISSPYGPGRKQHILDVIDCYEKDYQQLRTSSVKYPTAAELRAITKQGQTEEAPYEGFSQPTEGSEWIVACARKKQVRPLFLLVWGGLEDLAQALHDAPDILPNLRVYWIGGPNKKWSVNAYQYLVNNHPKLWFIEANDTYRGWFVGGNQAGQWGNENFVQQHIAGRGALGNFFATQLGGKIKMGDTPSVAWLLRGNPWDPSQPSWGGQFVRAWQRPFLKLNRMPSEQDQMELFGVLEIELPFELNEKAKPHATIEVENQKLKGDFQNGVVRFRFCPKSAKRFEFNVESNIGTLHGRKGAIQVFRPTENYTAARPWPEATDWWTDDPSTKYLEGPHMGARTVNRYREQFLDDFASRMRRLGQAAK